MMTLAVIGAPDIHRGPVFFWRAQMVRGAPTALTCVFVGFRTDFVTSVRVSVASAGVLALGDLRPAGARKPQGGTLSAPWLCHWRTPFLYRYVLHILSGWIHLHERTIFSHLGNA